MWRGSVEAQQTYALDGRVVGVHIAYFRDQGADSKLVSSRNVLVESQNGDWNQVAGGTHRLHTADSIIDLRTAELLGVWRPGAANRPALIVWRSYWVDGSFVAGDAAAKLRGALARLRGRGDDGAPSAKAWISGARLGTSSRSPSKNAASSRRWRCSITTA